MTKQRHSYIPSFKGYSFKPLEPEHEQELPDAATDPLLQPEDQGTIKRYLRYADTLINGSEINGSESSEPKDETAADNESVREVSLLGTRRSTDPHLPRHGDDLPSQGDHSSRDRDGRDRDKAKKAA